MIDNIKRELCTGCNACFNACPKKCIEMVEDDMGFRYPSVNYDNCISCKLCIKTCPSISKPDVSTKFEEPKVFAAWSLDEYVRFQSTSGGLFTELAKPFLLDGGVVVGARYNSENFVEHYLIDRIEDIEQLRQSKYVQSDIKDIFMKIESKLINGLSVAFCGTPCQVAGLLSYLRKPYPNLITIDFICLGVNSPKAYRKYLDMLESKFNSKVKNIWFKNKTYGWNRFSTRVDFENGRKYLKDRYKDLFMKGYIEENLYMRPCCAECLYKTLPRISDITLADFWGVGNIDTKLDTDKGTSLVMINSQKGIEYYQIIQNEIYSIESNLESVLPGNKAIFQSAKKNPNSELFLKLLDVKTFDESFNYFVKRNRYTETKKMIYRNVIFLKRFIFKKIRSR